MASKDSRSKRRSGTSSQPKPTYFVDRSLGGKQVATKLKSLGVSVQTHDDHFAQDANDEVWLSFVGKKKWLVLTADKGIRYRKTEKEALIRAGVGCFALISGNMTGDEMCEVFERALPNFTKFLDKNDPPFIAVIYKNGSIKLI